AGRPSAAAAEDRTGLRGLLHRQRPVLTSCRTELLGAPMSARKADSNGGAAVSRPENQGPAEQATRGTLKYVDDQFGSANFLKRSMDKVFPDHWSFMLGEIALYSFVILLLSGVYLTLFFHASQNVVTYHGSYQPLRGVQMTEAYDSTLHIS